MKRLTTCEYIHQVECIVRDTSAYTITHDGSTGWHLFLGNHGQSRVFSRVYEVYLDKRAQKCIDEGDLVGLFDYDEVYIRFHYDYRDDKKCGKIELSNYSLQKLSLIYPLIYEAIISPMPQPQECVPSVQPSLQVPSASSRQA